MSEIGKLAIELFKKDGYSIENNDASFERQNEYAKIARHVLEEMERCAAIAKSDSLDGFGYIETDGDLRDAIAAAIRRR